MAAEGLLPQAAFLHSVARPAEPAFSLLRAFILVPVPVFRNNWGGLVTSKSAFQTWKLFQRLDGFQVACPRLNTPPAKEIEHTGFSRLYPTDTLDRQLLYKKGNEYR